MSWEKEVKDIKNKRHMAEQMGGKEATDLQHNKGRLTIRERIEGVLDKKSFDEVGKIAGHSEYDTEGTLKNFTPFSIEAIAREIEPGNLSDTFVFVILPIIDFLEAPINI